MPQGQRLGKLGPSKVGPLAAGTGVYCPAGMSEFLHEKTCLQNRRRLLWQEMYLERTRMSHRGHGACGVHSLVVCSRDSSLEGLGHRRLGLLLLEQVSIARLGCPSSYMKKLPAKQKKAAVAGDVSGTNKNEPQRAWGLWDP